MTETAPITDEAARKANTAYWEAFLLQSTQELDNDDAQHIAAIRAALEAALPYLTPQPVASRERVAEGLREHEFKAVGGPGQEVFICYCGFVFEEPGADGYYGGPYSLHLADAVLALTN